MNLQQFPIVIIGGGPVGLAAAAQLAQRKLPFRLLEKGRTVGESLRQWAHVRMFSPWEYNIDRAAEALLVDVGWTSPDRTELPTGAEMVEQYLQPLAEHPLLGPNIVTDSRVVFVQRYGMDKMKTAGRATFPFEIGYERAGELHRLYASAIIDATGTWHSPNPAGAGGNPATGELALADRIAYGVPEVRSRDRQRYAGKRVAVIGSGHSAINSILELDRLKQAEPDTAIVWVLRRPTADSTFGGGEEDALPARGALGTQVRRLIQSGRVQVEAPFRLHTVEKSGERIRLIGLSGHRTAVIGDVDELVVNTGARPDFSFLREVRVAADPALESVPALAELIDPNVHSCGTVRPHGEAELRQPEPQFYVVGAKSYGRAPTFLMATGYEQVRSIAAALAGDEEAARKVELHLPETGVCGVPTS